MFEGIPGLGSIFQIITGLGGLFGGNNEKEGLQRLSSFVFDNVLAGENLLHDQAKSIWDTLKHGLLGLGGLLGDLWRDHLHGLLKRAFDWLKRQFDWIKKHATAIQKAIERIRNWYNKHILPWQLLVQEILSRVRVALELLRLLGFKWAAKLDADLQTLQGWVTESIQAILGPLNSALTVLGIAIDPGLLIRRDFFARSLWNSLGDLKRAAGYGSARPVYASEHQQEKQMHDAVWGSRPLSSVGADGSLVLDPALQTVDDSITQQMRTLGLGP